ncbi:MAG: glycogen debranching N-terminal domain-containing protein, partial [Gemmatimonadaceae bacterium]
MSRQRPSAETRTSATPALSAPRQADLGRLGRLAGQNSAAPGVDHKEHMDALVRPHRDGNHASGPRGNGDLAVAYVAPDLSCAWRGPALLVVARASGSVGPQLHPITGFYLNEARLLSSLQLEINGKAPWLCEAAQEDATRLTFSYIHPEMA